MRSEHTEGARRRWSRVEPWLLGLSANLVVAAGYLAISGAVFVGILRSGQVRGNPLALATAAIFLSCGVGHGAHALHALPLLADSATVDAARTMLADPHIWVLDGATAVVAVWYWTLRNRFPALVRGAALFEDMRVRRRQALQIHDDVVQGLVKAKLAFEVGDSPEGHRHLEATLASARSITSELLGEEAEGRVRPGELRLAAESRGG